MLIRGRGFRPYYFQKHLFEIMVDPKGPLSGSTFWFGFEAQDRSTGCEWWPIFGNKISIIVFFTNR